MAASSISHLVLARKWRPERFEELVGQEHVTRTLIQALRSGRIAHAFLFTGIRGVGKTTAARILARCLNCAEGPTPEPCGKCAACVEIRGSGALDTVEIDGATYRKIDDARAIIENLGYRPARDRFKIYIIDEAHQLTDQAFNALLKTLEEPPPHVKFILATTEPQKMPETILSRLQRYDFRRIPFATILARLKQLAEREEIPADEAALTLLAREAGGSMRDAERMLETAIASLDGRVTETEVASILGVASRTRVIELAGSVLAKDAAAALSAIRELNQRGANLEALGRDILEMLRNLAVVKLPASDGAPSPLADLPDQEAAALRDLAAKASLRDLMRLFHLMADAQEQLMRSPYPDLILEMAIVRMATLAPVMDADELLRAIGSSGSVSGSTPPTAVPAKASRKTGSIPADPPPSSAASLAQPEAAPVASVSVRPAVAASPPPTSPFRAAFEQVGFGSSSATTRIPMRGEIKADAPRRDPAPAKATQARPPSSPDLPDLRDFIRGRRAALAGFMEQGAALRLDDTTLTITPLNDIYIRYMSDNRPVIADLASELYGRKIKVEIATANPAATDVSTAATATADSASASDGPLAVNETETSAVSDATAISAPRSTAEVREALYSDPVVRRIFNELEARLVEVRADPLRSSGEPKK